MSCTFLSEEWFTLLAEKLAAGPPLPGDGSESLRLGQLVTDVQDRGEIEWTLVLQGGTKPRLEVGTTAEADVVLIESYQAALSLTTRSRTAADLLATGEIKIRGDARRIVSGAALLDAALTSAGSLADQPPAGSE